ncbi:Hypothetical predicted protein [Paramuricea clavata]|uniref:Uncharacterized protein n=1 Tax=Paramuricea clavata TaxID=317549 RepID=A0A6S7HWW9_PARCT|nr:Hypothetical predicted protein [Paramuricea clavata]
MARIKRTAIALFLPKGEKKAVKKTCHALRTNDVRRVTGQDDISKEQVRFYKELYSKVPTDKVAQDQLLNLLDRKLTGEQRDSCGGQSFFTWNEVSDKGARYLHCKLFVMVAEVFGQEIRKCPEIQG